MPDPPGAAGARNRSSTPEFDAGTPPEERRASPTPALPQGLLCATNETLVSPRAHLVLDLGRTALGPDRDQLDLLGAKRPGGRHFSVDDRLCGLQGVEERLLMGVVVELRRRPLATGA